MIGTRISVSSSSSASRVVMNPVKKSSSGIVRAFAGVGEGHPRIQREQRDGDIAARRWREQVPADGREVADGPAGGAARRLGEHREVALLQRAGSTSSVAPIRRAAVVALDPVQAGVAQAHHRPGQGDALVDERHRDRAAGHHEQVGTVRSRPASSASGAERGR